MRKNVSILTAHLAILALFAGCASQNGTGLAGSALESPENSAAFGVIDDAPQAPADAVLKIEGLT